ncbi:MAG: sulfide-dependent adenosine diphosphate thiazole synthase [Desulfonatronovibrionaceae bacterium]
MALDEIVISKAIIETFTSKLMDNLELDVAVCGAGPSGMVAAYYLAKAGKKTAVFERKLSIGGGMWGGGMMFNEIVVQAGASDILRELGVRLSEYQPGYFTADAVEAVCTIASSACRQGARFFNLVSVEDVMIREDRVTGLVINWSAVDKAGLHVDPLTVRTKYMIESTGHPVEVMQVIERKVDARLNTPSGGLEGEKSMWAEKAEQSTVENTREAFPGVYVCGMSANATFGSFRMGPIFGGMLMSGKKAAESIIEKLG